MSVEAPGQRPRLQRSQSAQGASPDGPAPSPQPHIPPVRHSTHILAARPASPPAPVDIPQRPARHPARSLASPLPAPLPTRSANPMLKKLASETRPRTATGSREDVTPWELYPAPDYSASNIPASPELQPSSPSTSKVNTSRPSSSGGRPSASGSRPSGLHFPDGLVRRRKSTGTKTIKSKPVMGNGTSRPSLPPSIRSPPSRSNNATKSPLRANTTGAPPSSFYPFTSAMYAGPFLAPVSFPNAPTPAKNTSSRLKPESAAPLLSDKQRDKQKENDNENHLKFSTADRTILEELKRNISAREAQFIVKGGLSGCVKPGFGPNGGDGWGAASLGGLGIMGGRKHHPFGKDEVPYPRSYERDVLDLDIWETSFCQQICDSMTWHVFAEPPKKVLDVGCGTGAWILNCARVWRDCSFVGLDIVPLHPDLHRVGSMDLAQRITWTQGNFLEFLPFPNEEFDYVHIKRIALGVPEDKWDHLFEEIIRVLKPGGAFEMIEEDLFFPGRAADEADDDSDIGSDSRSNDEVRRRSANSIPHSDVTRSSEQDGDDGDTDSTMPTSLYDSGISARKSEDVSPPSIDTSSPRLMASPSAVSLSASQASMLPSPSLPVSSTAIVEADEDRTDSNGGTITQASHAPRKSMSSLVNASPMLQRKPSLPKHSSAFLSASMDATKTPSKLYSGSSISLQAPNTGSLDAVVQETRTRRLSIATPSAQTIHSPSTADFPPRPVRPPPFLTRPLRPPMNPRDHTVLETIYNEMQASRFINLSPLSLLPNYLNLHFTDVRTHPPIQFAFPPLQPKTVSKQSDESSFDNDDDPDEEARNAINPHPPRSPLFAKRPLSIDTNVDDERWVSARNLLHRTSQFVSLDDARYSGFSPRSSTSSTKFPPARSMSVEDAPPIPSLPVTTPSRLPKNHLPNQTLHIDTRTLNLHLALRATEILACSEEMWEWVVEYQAGLRRRRREEAAKNALRERSKSVDMAHGVGRRNSLADRPLGWKEPNGPKAIVAELSREDFEGLLVRFDMDMRDHMAFGTQLEDRFSWSSFPSTPTAERKVFDAACEKYQRWEEEQRQKVNSVCRPTSSMFSGTDGHDYTFPPLPSHGHSSSDHLLVRGHVSRPEPTSTLRSLSASPSFPASSVPLPPPASTKRLSRTMGVFVAWKSRNSSSHPGDD